jgi:polar amino acid transport system substrate-binding protein
MKVGSAGRAALGAALLAWATAGAGAASNCSAPVAMGTGQLEPYGYYDARQRYVGMDADMIRAIMAEAGCTLVELPLMPDGRNLLLFDQGRIGLMAGATPTPARRKRAWFSIAYREETVGLFSLAGAALALPSFADVVRQPVRVVAPRAGWYGAEYERERDGLKARGRLYQFDSLPQGVRMLAAGRAHLMLGDAAGVERAAAHLGVAVRPLPFWLVQAPVHLMLNRAVLTEADVARIDAAIVRLQRSGALDAIRRAYGGK